MSSELSDSEPEDRKSNPDSHTVPARQHRPSKHPIPHQQPEHSTFLPQAFSQCQFLETPGKPRPTSNYAKNFKPVSVLKLKAFIGLRLKMK